MKQFFGFLLSLTVLMATQSSFSHPSLQDKPLASSFEDITAWYDGPQKFQDRTFDELGIRGPSHLTNVAVNNTTVLQGPSEIYNCIFYGYLDISGPLKAVDCKCAGGFHALGPVLLSTFEADKGMLAKSSVKADRAVFNSGGEVFGPFHARDCHSFADMKVHGPVSVFGGSYGFLTAVHKACIYGSSVDELEVEPIGSKKSEVKVGLGAKVKKVTFKGSDGVVFVDQKIPENDLPKTNGSIKRLRSVQVPSF